MIVSLLVKKNIITLVPIDKTFFHCIDFISTKKLSLESILFNYQKLSPFVNSSVSYVQKEDKLLLWFYEKSSHSLFTIPEGYLYYKYFSKNHDDALITIENKTIFVMQNRILYHQSAIIKSSQEEVELLSKKYHIKKVIDKTTFWNEANYKKILNQPIISLIANFVDKKLLLQMIKKKLSLLVIPLFIFLSFMTIVHFAINQYLQKELEILINQKKETKIQTKEMFGNIAKNNQDIFFFKTYLQKHGQSSTDVLEQLSEIVKKQNINLFYVEYNMRFMALRAECENIESFLEELSNIEKIKSYKLMRQVKLKNGKKEIIVEIDMQTERELDE